MNKENIIHVIRVLNEHIKQKEQIIIIIGSQSLFS